MGQLLEAGASFPSTPTSPGHYVQMLHSRGSIFAKSIWIRAGELFQDIKKKMITSKVNTSLQTAVHAIKGLEK